MNIPKGQELSFLILNDCFLLQSGVCKRTVVFNMIENLIWGLQ